MENRFINYEKILNIFNWHFIKLNAVQSKNLTISPSLLWFTYYKEPIVIPMQ
jgi:hypothetical protein